MSKLLVNGVDVNLGAETTELAGIQNCPVCASRLCGNGGSCVAAATEVGYQCSCPSGFSGNQCELRGLYKSILRDIFVIQYDIIVQVPWN